MTEDVYEVHYEEAEAPPEPPPHGPIVWMKTNLFSTPANSVLTIVFGIIVLVFFWTMVGFVIGEGRRWDAVTANARLLMVQAYPEGKLDRVWFSVGIVIVLGAATLAAWRMGDMTSRFRLGRGAQNTGGFVTFVSLIMFLHLVFDGRNPTAGILGLLFGLALLGVGFRLKQGADAKAETTPTLLVSGVLLAIPVALLWVVQLPRPLAEGGQVVEPIALSTKLPWTILYLLAIGAYVLFRSVLPESRTTRAVVVGLWALSFPLIVMVILRDPIIPWSEVANPYLPVGLAFAVVGAGVMWIVSDPNRKEAGYGIGALLALLFVLSWLFSILMIVRLLLLAAALFTLAAPTFAGERQARLRYAASWVGVVLLTTYFVILVIAESSIEVPSGSFLGGLMLTFVLAIAGTVLSFPIGVILALARTSTLPLFRLLSTAYIELIRGVPLITWLLVAFVLFPFFLPPGLEIAGVVRAIFAVTFFSAAYLAENIRGGLQSIGRGQYEASKALGMTTVQMTVFITLPQALRAVIPALVSQVIALFKDTSLVTVVGLFDLLHIARAVIPNQSQPFNFIGVLKEPLLIAALIYWIFTFAMSRASLRLEKKLGLGER